MELTKNDAKILEVLVQSGEMPQSKLALVLKMQKSNLSLYLKRLQSFGLVNLVKHGRKNSVIVSQLFNSEYSKLPFNLQKIVPLAITGLNPHIISYFCNCPEFRIKELPLPSATAKRILSRLRKAGIIFMKKKGIYCIREEMKELGVFCRSLLYIMYFERALKELGQTKCKVVCQGPASWTLIFVTSRMCKSQTYFPTAYSVFSKYGVNLILTNKNYYTNMKPTIEDVVIHTIELSLNNSQKPPLDPRMIMYVSALILKNKISYQKLIKVKCRSGITDAFLRELFNFINSKGEKTFQGFPSWKEVEGVAYG